MSVIIQMPNNPQEFGFGARIIVQTNIASPLGAPFTYTWQFHDPLSERFSFSTSRLVTSNIPAEITLGYTDTSAPEPLMQRLSIPAGISTVLNVQMRDDGGALIDEGTVTWPWTATTFAHYDNYLLNQHFQGTGGTIPDPTDKLDQIINAVYRTWPDA